MIAIYMLSAFVIGLLGAWLMTNARGKLKMVDQPDERRSHSEPTPRNGGIGIWAVIVIGAFVFLKNPSLAIIIFILGLLCLLDGIIQLRAKFRLFMHLALALIAALAVSGIPANFIQLALMFFLIIFIAWSANVYNFMDGIDGMAGVIGAVSFGSLAFFAYFIYRDPTICLFAAMIACACIGFLPFNFPRAKIFMGDVSSITLGFIFAVFALTISATVADFICLAAFMSTFYADEIITMFVRMKDKDNLLQAHRKHIYQILANEKNIAHWKIAAAYGLIQLLTGAVFISLRLVISSPGILTGAATLVLLLYLISAIIVNNIVRNAKESKFIAKP